MGSEDVPRGATTLRRVPSEVLTAAIERVHARLDEIYPSLAPGGRDRAEAYLHTVQAKLAQVLEGARPEPIRDSLSRSPLFDPLMEAVFGALLEGAEGPEAGSPTLAVLRAWAAVHRTTENVPGVEFEEASGLRYHLRGAGAFELLVEVVHDFRSPLTSILFLAEALRDCHSGPLSDLQRSQLGLIYSAAFGLASVASDVMDLARRERDLIEEEPQPFAVGEVFRSVERMVRPLVEEKGLELRVVAPERWQALGHPHPLSRVLLNLTTNALKFTDHGSVEIGVRPLPHRRLEFYVQDTGRGMTPQQQERLFQPFKERPGSAAGQGHYFSGSGIGLSMARRLLRAMASDLRLDSSDERGTRFSFVLSSSPRA